MVDSLACILQQPRDVVDGRLVGESPERGLTGVRAGISEVLGGDDAGLGCCVADKPVPAEVVAVRNDIVLLCNRQLVGGSYEYCTTIRIGAVLYPIPKMVSTVDGLFARPKGDIAVVPSYDSRFVEPSMSIAKIGSLVTS